jgi:hypothetical protein
MTHRNQLKGCLVYGVHFKHSIYLYEVHFKHAIALFPACYENKVIENSIFLSKTLNLVPNSTHRPSSILQD